MMLLIDIIDGVGLNPKTRLHILPTWRMLNYFSKQLELLLMVMEVVVQ
jgi:hypothetical protein